MKGRIITIVLAMAFAVIYVFGAFASPVSLAMDGGACDDLIAYDDDGATFSNAAFAGKAVGSTVERGNRNRNKKRDKIIVIDAGHQKKANMNTEPIGPGARTRKPKVTGGTRGVATLIPEYKINLQVAK
jgi:hypothetical protein